MRLMLDVLQNSPVEVIKRQGGEIKMSEELLIAFGFMIVDL